MAFKQASAVPVSYDELVDKIETGYVDAPNTPNVASTSQGKAVSGYAVQSVHMRECLAEFLGTFAMIVFGMGVNNEVVKSEEKNGTWLSINMCWGVTVLIGVYYSEGINDLNLLGWHICTDMKPVCTDAYAIILVGQSSQP
ncbi:hypothetical protein JG688_00012397 [Phytophthora aleatoria]|uniref:Aquaporin n=1 Tax=Phytophthora aleatoria TaxID=2496075 RepID=A0A8J5MER5_9STRA|nr:hypothetical protein JG688_00012397 [Phytophthora aleatoria]